MDDIDVCYQHIGGIPWTDRMRELRVGSYRGVYPRGGVSNLPHFLKVGGLKDWLFQLICGAWIVRRIGLYAKSGDK